jgi:hypothetical protein
VPAREWLPEFLIDHYDRLDIKPAPPYPSEEWESRFRGWIDWFDKHDVTRAVADAASIRLQIGGDPPRWWMHLDRLQETILAVQADARANETGRAAALTFEQAREAAKDCPDPTCQGSGFAIRYSRHPNRRTLPNGRVHMLPSGHEVRFFCRCALGRWMVARYQGVPRERWPAADLEAHPDLWVQWDEAAQRWWHPAVVPPEVAASPIVGMNAIRDLVHAWDARRDAPTDAPAGQTAAVADDDVPEF